MQKFLKLFSLIFCTLFLIPTIGNSQVKFVVGGWGTNSIASSSDGINWTGSGAGILDGCYTIAYRETNSYNRWVAGGYGANSIACSFDGTSWYGLGNSIFEQCSSVAWNGRIWVAVGYGANSIAYSHDGVNWYGLGNNFLVEGMSIAWNGTMWIAVGLGSNKMARSYDGINWINTYNSNFSLTTQDIINKVVWSGDRWFILTNGSTQIASSTDGVNWTGGGLNIFGGYAPRGNNISWNGSIWVAAGYGTNTIATSTDGITWTARGGGIFSFCNNVSWNGTMWVAVGYGSNSIATSTDGINWTGRGNSVFQEGRGILWNGTSWIACGYNRSIASSTDGINWTTRGTGILDGAITLATKPIPDTTPPTILCIGNQVLTATSTNGVTAALPDYRIQAPVSDNLSSLASINYKQIPEPNTLINNSQNVTLTATDFIGNSSSCSFTVTVIPMPLSGGTITPSKTVDTNTDPVTLSNVALPSGGGSTYYYQWFASSNGSSWFSLPGATSISYSRSALTATTYFRRQVNDNLGNSAYSNTSIFTLFKITSQPQTQIVCEGETVNLSIGCDGCASVTPQWQSSSDGVSWTDISGATASNYSFNASYALNGKYYRCVLSGQGNTFYSNSARITVNKLPVITQQPISAKGCESVIFSTTVTGSGLYYQWQEKVKGSSTWTDLQDGVQYKYEGGYSGYGVVLNASRGGSKFRCKIKSEVCPPIYTDEVEAFLNVNPTVKTRPTDQTICQGQDATFLLEVEGDVYSIEWKKYINGVLQVYDPFEWSIGRPSPNSRLITVPSAYTEDGAVYRYEVYGCNYPTDNSFPIPTASFTSGEVRINVVKPPVFTMDRESNLWEHSIMSLTVHVTDPTLLLQWQESTDDGVTWNDITWINSNGDTIPFTSNEFAKIVDMNMDGNWYRVRVTNELCGYVAYGLYVLNVMPLPQITPQPLNREVCEGNEITLTTSAVGEELSYQWYKSTDGITWNIINGANSNTYTQFMSVGGVMEQFKYTVTSWGIKTITSEPFIVTVKKKPIIITQPNDVLDLCELDYAYFSVSALGDDLSYQWQLWSNNGQGWSWIDIGGANAPNYKVQVYDNMNNHRFRCLVNSSYCGSLESYTATIFVKPKPVIANIQSSTVYSCEGENAYFLATISGSYCSSVWQMSSDGGQTWTNLINQTSPNLSLPYTSISMTGYKYRFVVNYDRQNPVYSTPYTLNVVDKPEILTQPSDVYVAVGGNITLSMTTTDPVGGTVNYSWYKKTGSNWDVLDNSNSKTISFSASPEMNGSVYFGLITTVNSIGKICDTFTRDVTVTVSQKPAIPVDPNYTYNGGSTVVTLNAPSTSDVVYYWQTQPDGVLLSDMDQSKTFTSESTLYLRSRSNISPNLWSDPLTVNAKVYAQISCGSITASASIFTTSSIILSNSIPASGGKAPYTYQWQSSIDGSSWDNISGASNSSYTLSSLLQTTWFHLKVTDNNGKEAYSNNIQITLPSSVIGGTTNPAALTVASGVVSGSVLSVSGAGGGTGVYDYLWQSSVNGVDWANLSTGSSFTLPSLTQTTQFKRKMTDRTTAGVAYSIPSVVTVNLSGGTITTVTTTIPPNTSPGIISNETLPTGGDGGYTYRWESSINGGTSWEPVSGADNTAYEPSALMQTTSFRRKVITNTTNTSPRSATVTIAGSGVTPNKTVTVNQAGTQTTDKTVGNTDVYTSVDTDAYRRAIPVTLTEAGSITSISIYHGAGTGSLLLGVYTDQSGTPASLLGVTPSTAVSGTTGWQTVALASPVPVTSGQTVWLSYVFQTNPGVRYMSGTPARALGTTAWAGGMPATFGTATFANYKFSLYCTYASGSTPSLDVSPASISLGSASGSNGTFTITSNTTWTITDDASWLDQTAVSGTNNGTITLSANSANTGTVARSATVTIAGTGVTPNKTVTVTQAGTQTTDKTVGNTDVYTSVDTDPYRRAIPVTLTESGSIASISIYHGVGTGSLLLGVYADQSGTPSSLLGVTPSTAVSGTTGWQTVALTSPVPVTPGQTVWLSYVFQTNPGVRYTSGTPARALGTTAWAGGMPATFGTSTFANYKFSLYCTYTTVSTPSLAVSPASISLGSASGSNGTFTITSNTTWTITDDAPWLEVLPVSGTNNGIITVTDISSNDAYSNTTTITVTLSGGEIDPTVMTIDPNTSPGTILSNSAASGGSGIYSYQWQNSVNGTSWSDISGANTLDYVAPALTQKTWYRRKVTNGINVEYTNNAIAEVRLSGGTINPSAMTIASGTSPGIISNNLAASGGTPGYTYQWENSADGEAWTSISDSIGTSFTPPVLTQSMYYRRKVTDGNLTVAYSNVAAYTVTLSGGSITPVSQTIVAGTSPQVLTNNPGAGGAPVGNIQWQISTDNGTIWSDISGATQLSYSPPALTQRTCYRRKVTDSNNNVAYSNISYARIDNSSTNSLTPYIAQPVSDATNSSSIGSIAGQADVLLTGSATYQVPIDIAPGTGGIQPDLSVVYNSMGGDGLLGMGSNLGGLSVITRVSKNLYYDNAGGAVNFDDNNDRFVLDGNRLITNSANYGSVGNAYFTESDNSTRITSKMGTDNKLWFEVETKNGRILEFGHTPDSRILSDNGTVIAWKINKVIDKNTNYILYVYNENDDEKPISEIKYTGNTAESKDPYNAIRFFYQRKTNATKGYINGQPFINDMLLKTIEVESENRLVRTYGFEYTFDNYTHLTKITETDGAGELLNPTVIEWGANNTAITSGTFNFEQNPANNSPSEFYASANMYDETTNLVCVHDVVNENNIPGHSIEVYIPLWTGGSIYGFRLGEKYAWWGSLATETYSRRNSGLLIDDVYGEGTKRIIIPTLLHETDVFDNYFFDFHILGHVNATLTGGYIRRYALKIKTEQIPLYTTADIDNDGRSEIIALEKLGQNNSYSGGLLGCWSAPQYVDQMPIDASCYNFTLTLNEDPIDIFTGDFNSDGLADLMVVTNNGIYTFANENGHFNSTRKSYSAFSNFHYSFGRQGDFNNDGIPDLLLSGYYQQNLKIAYSNGDYSFAIRDVISNIGANIMGLDDDRTVQDDDNCMVTDFNNDGKTDFILLNAIWEWDQGNDYDFKEFKTTWYQSNEAGFIKVKEHVSTNGIDGHGKNYFSGDFNGDGRMDLINYGYDCYDGNLETKWRKYESLDAGYDAQKVISVTDGFKQKTEFIYRPLTYSKKPDGTTFYWNSGNPPMDNIVRSLPPIPFVSYLITPDGKGGTSTTSYSYMDMNIHLLGKGFLGFSQINASNTTSNRKVISVIGGITDSYINPEITQTLVRTFNNSPISTTINSPVYKSLGNKRFTLHSSNSTSTDHLKNVAVITDIEFDDWGNPTKTTVNYGPKDFVVANSEGSVVTENVFTNDGSWCKSRLSETTVTKKIGIEPESIRKSKFIYDQNLGRLLSKTSDPLLPKAVTETYSEFDKWGNPHKVVLSASGLTERSTQFEYDTYGRFVEKETKEINATKYLVEHKYDGRFGVLLSEKTADGYTTTHQYDGFGKKKKSILPDGREVTTLYTWVDNNIPVNAKYAVTVALAGEPTTKTIYDAFGRELRTETPSFSGLTYTDKEYNANGTLKQVSLPYFAGGTAKWTTYNYDPYERITGQTFGNQTSTFSYEIEDGKYKVTTTNPANQASYKVNDALGNVVKAHDNGGDIDYTYFSSGQVKDITSNASKTEMHYDEYGRQDYLIDPDAGRIDYTYNAFGELETQKDAENHLYTMEYDDFGRLKTKTCNGKTTTTNYIDAVGTNGLGQIGSVTGPDGTTKTTYTYGNFGRISKISEMVDGQTFDTEYTYNTNGKLENQIFPSGIGQRFSVTNTYDSNGYLNEVKKSDGTVIWKMMEANALGQVKQSRLGTALTTTKTYDDVYGTLTSIQTPGIQNNQYEFDPATGNLNFRTDVNRNLKESFEYSNLNCLRLVKVNDVVKQSLEYLPNGNIDSNGKTNSTNGLGKYYYNAIPDHAVSGIDNTDNIVSTDPQNITYTSFNKVDLITEGNAGEANYRTLQYLYGPDQQRRRTVFNNGSLQKTTYFIGSYEKEIIGANTRELHYIGGGDGLAAVYIKINGTGALFYILKDHLGSIQFIRSEDGLTTEESSFDAWGCRRNPADYTDFNVAPSNYLNRGFTGHEHLNAFSLIDMNGRVYDPILGRFLSPDPYVQMPGFTQSFNHYSYCLNNPLIFTDPSGELPVWMLWPISWGGNWLMGGLDRWINGKQSFSQAFAPKNNPIMISGNFSPDNMTRQNNYGFSNYQVDAQTTANLPYQIGTDAVNKVRSEYNMNEWRATSRGGVQHQVANSDAYAKYGQIIGNFNISGTLSLGGGGTVEFGYVVTDKSFAQYYISLYSTASISAGISGSITVIDQHGEFVPTISNWKGDCWEIGGNYYVLGGQWGGDSSNIYSTYTGGIGYGVSFPASGTGSANYGKTYLIGRPIDLNPPKGYFTNLYIQTGGY